MRNFKIFKMFFLIQFSAMWYRLALLRNQTKLFKTILYSSLGPSGLACYLAGSLFTTGLPGKERTAELTENLKIN
jgi:hypothetical protein